MGVVAIVVVIVVVVVVVVVVVGGGGGGGEAGVARRGGVSWSSNSGLQRFSLHVMSSVTWLRTANLDLEIFQNSSSFFPP